MKSLLSFENSNLVTCITQITAVAFWFPYASASLYKNTTTSFPSAPSSPFTSSSALSISSTASLTGTSNLLSYPSSSSSALSISSTTSLARTGSSQTLADQTSSYVSLHSSVSSTWIISSNSSTLPYTPVSSSPLSLNSAISAIEPSSHPTSVSSTYISGPSKSTDLPYSTGIGAHTQSIQPLYPTGSSGFPIALSHGIKTVKTASNLTQTPSVSPLLSTGSQIGGHKNSRLTKTTGLPSNHTFAPSSSLLGSAVLHTGSYSVGRASGTSGPHVTIIPGPYGNSTITLGPAAVHTGHCIGLCVNGTRFFPNQKPTLELTATLGLSPVSPNARPKVPEIEKTAAASTTSAFAEPLIESSAGSLGEPSSASKTETCGGVGCIVNHLHLTLSGLADYSNEEITASPNLGIPKFGHVMAGSAAASTAAPSSIITPAANSNPLGGPTISFASAEPGSNTVVEQAVHTSTPTFPSEQSGVVSTPNHGVAPAFSEIFTPIIPSPPQAVSSSAAAAAQEATAAGLGSQTLNVGAAASPSAAGASSPLASVASIFSAILTPASGPLNPEETEADTAGLGSATPNGGVAASPSAAVSNPLGPLHGLFPELTAALEATATGMGSPTLGVGVEAAPSATISSPSLASVAANNELPPVVTIAGFTFAADASPQQPSADANVVSPAAVPLVITFAGSQITANSESAFIVGSQTLAPNSPLITVSGTPLSLAPSAVFIGTSAVPFSPVPSLAAYQAPAVITVGGSTLTANAQSQFVYGSQTLAPNSPVTISGTPISLAPAASAIIVGDSTMAINSAGATQLPVITFGSDTITANAASQFLLGSQTLLPGSEIVVSGTPVSLAPSASAVIIGDNTLPINNVASTPLALTFDGSVITANSASEFLIAGETLKPGSDVTISGTPISLAPQASDIILGDSTIALSPGTTPKASLPVLTFAGSVITADSAGDFLIAGKTLTPGAAVTISGTPISLAPDATVAVIGSSTLPLVAAIPGPELPVLTFAGSTITANSAHDFVIGSQTLFPGSIITISGTPISLAPSAKDLIIGTSTIPLNFVTPAPSSVPVLTLGSSILTANSQDDFIIDGKTLVPGGSAIEISSTTYSLAAQASDIIVGTSTIPLGRVTSLPSAVPVFTLGNSILTANSNDDFIIDGKTLAPGGPPVTLSGTTYSLASKASDIIIGSSTVPLSFVTPASFVPILTLGTSVITANSLDDFVIGGKTLVPGGPAITVSGSVLSLMPSASDLVIDGSSTVPLSGASPTSAVTAASTPLTGLAGEVPLPIKMMAGACVGALGMVCYIL